MRINSKNESSSSSSSSQLNRKQQQFEKFTTETVAANLVNVKKTTLNGLFLTLYTGYRSGTMPRKNTGRPETQPEKQL